MAGHLWQGHTQRSVRKRRWRIISWLQLHHRKIDRIPIEAGWSSRLQPTNLKSKITHAIGEVLRGRLPSTTSGKMIETDMDQPLQKCARRKHYCPRMNRRTGIRDDTGYSPTPGENAINCPAPDLKCRLRTERALHDFAIDLLIALRAQGTDGRTLAGVDHPKLDAGLVGISPHFSA